MGEGITGFISAKSGPTQVTIFIRGRISKECLEQLKILIKKWAEQCGLRLKSVNVKLAALKKAKKKKKRK